MKPKRIQRKRTKGWRMPENTVYVGRPSKWGNIFRADKMGQDKAVSAYRRWLAGKINRQELKKRFGMNPIEIVFLTVLRNGLLKQLPGLKGKNLACWCRSDQPCHGSCHG